MKPEAVFGEIRKLMMDHHRQFSSVLPMVASENVTSMAVREAEICDFSHRYAEGWPGERVYAGCKYIDGVELRCVELAKKIFEAEFADVRPVSGVSANLVMYAATMRPGDVMMATPIPSGGHISHGPLLSKDGKYIGGTAGNICGLDVRYMAFNHEEMNIDVDETKKRILENKPKLLLFGASVFLFPHPVRELAETAKEVGAVVGYDSAHVLGLIAGRQFQQPLKEGVDIMTGSTHKTLAGPQHGIVLAKPELGEKIKKTTFPSAVSNHHLHNVAGLAIALAETMKYGEPYAKQVIANAQTLAQELHGHGFKVLGEKNGFTKSHTVLVDIVNLKDKVGLGGDVERLLEKSGIICNRNMLPYDGKEGRNYMNPGGIRLGTSELTKLGMKKGEMKHVARLFKDVLMDGKPPEKVAKEIAAFRKKYQTLHYCFGNPKNIYKYVKLA